MTALARPRVEHAGYGRHFMAALSRTSTRIVVGWHDLGVRSLMPEPDELDPSDAHEPSGHDGLVLTPDHELLEQFIDNDKRRYPVVDNPARPRYLRSLRPRLRERLRVRASDVLREEAGLDIVHGRLELWREPAPPVISTILPTERGEREVFNPGLFARAMQRSVCRVLQPHLEKFFSPTSYAYRPGRGTRDALECVNQFVRDGMPYVRKLDVRQCYPSIRLELLDQALRMVPFIDNRWRRLLLWFCYPRHVYYKPDHPYRLRGEVTGYAGPPPGCLLQGTPVAPMLCNIVLSVLLDQPFTAAFGSSIGLARYSDDVIIAAKSPEEVEQATRVIETVLGHGDLALKEYGDVVDLRRDSIKFLGKRLHHGRTTTSRERRGELLDRAVSAEPEYAAPLYRATIDELRADSDPNATIGRFEMELRRLVVEHGKAFAAVRKQTRQRQAERTRGLSRNVRAA